MTNPRWQGIFPAITTKFHADESIDAEGTARHIDFQIRNGIHGLVTCGSLGEASTLTLEEKLQVAKIALEAADGRIPVLANVSETSTREALRYVDGANKLGVAGFMVMPSVIYVADAREAMLNVRTIANAAQKPIMVYNNPVAYRVDLKPEHMLELADCEWIAAIKESTDDIRRITDLRNTVGDRYQLFLGVDDLAYEGLALGCDGLLAIEPVRQGWPENIFGLSLGSRHCASAVRTPDAVASGVQTVPPPHCQVAPKRFASSGIRHGIAISAGV